MIKLWHAPRSRSNRVVWLCEEMGLDYELVSLKLGEKPPELLAMNPAATVPVMTDGEKVFFESITMMEYIAETYGPTDLAVNADEESYWDYRQMLLFGEATLSAPINFFVATIYAPEEADRADNFTLQAVRNALRKRAGLIGKRLETSDYVVADRFTLADISATYGLELGLKIKAFSLDEGVPASVADYVERMKARPAYQRMTKVR